MNKTLKNTLLTSIAGAAIGFSSMTLAATEIKAAFNQSDSHPQYAALAEFGKQLETATDGRYKVTIFPNALLGDQRASLELVQSGAVQMAVVANPLVENYDNTFTAIGMPFAYTGIEHQEKVFTSGVLDDLFASTKKFGFEVLTAYTAGSRNIYTKKDNVKTVDDMAGRKIRVMQSNTMVEMLSCMGGTGVPMSQGEVYTAIQQGVLDGGENNEITYADMKHYEVAPYFSKTSHLMVPDLVVISDDFMNSLPADDQATIRKLAKESTLDEFAKWNTMISDARALAEENGATFIDVDVKQFQDSCKPLQNKLIKTDTQKALTKAIGDLS
ncbi:TRAP transporter substrate-binding protein [Vibrio sp. SA48]|uniref:TRAP transporter substrate-binding protein n=1 Tax=Vibrio sp. S12_S33 TaxID=2720223 RepID=UPI001785F2C3|nr:TRAP transporter substrate-binding protein [Vibrio sp. S12_S33]MBD1567380.1 TRAP transporter substrate-binding protein [Vibrio sp. S12_S33]